MFPSILALKSCAWLHSLLFSQSLLPPFPFHFFLVITLTLLRLLSLHEIVIIHRFLALVPDDLRLILFYLSVQSIFNAFLAKRKPFIIGGQQFLYQSSYLISKFFLSLAIIHLKLLLSSTKKLDKLVDTQLLLQSCCSSLLQVFGSRFEKESINLFVRYCLLSLNLASLVRKPLTLTSCILNLRTAPGILGKFILNLPYIIIKLQSQKDGTVDLVRPFRMRDYLNIEQYIIMASRKRSKNSNQPKLMEYVSHQSTINSLLPIKDQIDKELLRLVKVRKEIECRRIEEDKIIRKILKLHISDKKEEVKEQVLVEDEEYLVLTTEECLEKESNPSLLKLILGGYGALHMNKKAVIEVEETQEETFESEQTVKQWVEHGNLKPQLMTDYSKDFIHYLKEMQYVADQLNAETKSKRF